MKNPLDKGKLWEKRRRDRLKESFHKLAQLLPQYDPARIPSQKDIIDKATQFVKELRLSNSRLLLNQTQSDEKNKLIQELQDEVNRLILRVKQLTVLLKQANITIPSGPTIKSLGKRKLKWSDKLSPDDVENKKQRLNNDSQAQSKEITKDSDTVCNGSAGNSQVTAAPLRETNNGHPDKEPEVVLSPVAMVSEEVNHSASFSAPPPPPQPQVLQSIAPMQTLTFSLPVQTTPTTTIILTPQTLPVSPLLTRITVPAPRILPKPNASTRLPKLPIVRVTQPIIKVKRTRNRKKKSQPSVKDTSVENNKSDAVEKLQPEANAKKDETKAKEPSKPVRDTQVSDKKEDEPDPEPPVLSIPEVETVENDVIVIETTVTAVPTEAENVSTDETPPAATPVASEKTPEVLESKIPESSETQKTCEVQTTQQEAPELQKAAEEPESENSVVTPGDFVDSLTTAEPPKEVQENEEAVSLQNVSENFDRITEATTESVRPPEESREEAVARNGVDEAKESSIQPNVPTSVALESSAPALEPSAATAAQKIPDPPPQAPPLQASVEENIPQSVALSESLQEIADLMQPPPTANPPPSSKSNRLVEDSVVTTDKISECIARSIDLIDQPENELMELSGDWGETSSPKSPISPTQMFLSMFPLLPRESLITSTEPSTNPKQSFTAGGKSSSFYIDSMLPDEQSSCSDNFSSRNTATALPVTSQVASTNLNIVNLLSTTTPSVEQLPSVTHNFGPADADADSSNPFSVSSISAPIRSAIYPVSSASNTTAAKATSASRASDFDFVLSPYSTLLSSSYSTNNTSKDMNWSPFTFSSSTRSAQPEVQPRRGEQPIASSAENSNTPKKSKSAGKELSTYKPYANTGPVSREEPTPAVSSLVQQQQKNAAATQPERASTPKRSKNSSKSQSPSRRQKDNSLSTPQKNHVADTYTPYTFHHQHHQPYQAAPVPPPPTLPVVPPPSDAPFTPYFQPANLPDLSSVSRLSKGCVGKDQDTAKDTRKRSSAVVNTNSVPSCPTTSMDFGSANFYDNMLPQSMHNQFSLGQGSKTQRHNQPFYLPDVPLQNLDFMQHAIPPHHQILQTNKNSSRTVHQQIDKYNYFPPVAPSQPGVTEFNYHSNLGMPHSGTQYHQHSQPALAQSAQTSSSCAEKKSGSAGTVELSSVQNSSLVQRQGPGQRQSQNQGMNPSQSQTQQVNQGQVQSQRQVRGKSPAQQSNNPTDQRQERNSFAGRHDNNQMRSRDQNQSRGHSDAPQVARPQLHPQHLNQSLNGARASMQSEDQRDTSRNREVQHHAEAGHQARSEHHGQAQRQEQRPSGPSQNRSLQPSNDASLQQTNIRDHSLAGSTSSHNQPPHNVYNAASQRDSQVQRGQEYQSSVGRNQHGLMQPQQSHPSSLQQSRGHVHEQPQGSQQQQQNSRRGNQKPDNQPYQQSQPQHVVQPRGQQGQNQQQQSQAQNQHQNQPHSNLSTSQGHNQQRIQQPQNHNNGQHQLHGHSQQPQGHSVAIPYQHQPTGSHSQSHHQTSSNAHSQGSQSQNQRQSHSQQPQGPQQPPQQQPKHTNQSMGQSSQGTATRSYGQQHGQIHSHTQNSSLVANSSQPHPSGHGHNPHSQSHSQMYPPNNSSNTGGAQQQQRQHHSTQNQIRPVNWMTDPPNTAQQQQSSSCNRKSNSTIPNPFSVSKLVGNSSSPSSQNSNNNNYCVEGLIRKNNPTNPEWPDFSSPSSLSCIHSQPGSHNQVPPAFSYQSAQPEYGNYGSFTHHSHPSQNQHHHAHYPSTSHFDQFGHNPHHHNQLRHHTSSSNNNNSSQNVPVPHQHSTASDNSVPQQSHQGSSVLNFNLSSIFPEMNDKRNHPAGGSSSNNSRGCNNFYSGTK